MARCRALIVLVLAAALAVAGCSSSSDGSSKNGASDGSAGAIRIHAYDGVLVSLYARIAEAEGIYDEFGLDAELVPIATGPQAIAAIQSKSIDVTLSTADVVMVASEKGVDLEAVVGNLAQPLFQIVASQDVLDETEGMSFEDRVQHMAGETIAVYGLGGSSDRLPNLLFQAAGVKDEPKYVIAGGPKTISALLADRVQYASDSVQIADLLEASGAGGTYISCDDGTCPDGVVASKQYYFVTPSFAEENPETVEAFADAQRAVDVWVKDPVNKAAVTDYLKEFYPAPDGVDADRYADLLYGSVQTMFGVDFGVEDFEKAAEVLTGSAQLTSDVDPDDFVWSGAADQ